MLGIAWVPETSGGRFVDSRPSVRGDGDGAGQGGDEDSALESSRPAVGFFLD